MNILFPKFLSKSKASSKENNNISVSKKTNEFETYKNEENTFRNSFINKAYGLKRTDAISKQEETIENPLPFSATSVTNTQSIEDRIENLSHQIAETMFSLTKDTSSAIKTLYPGDTKKQADYLEEIENSLKKNLKKLVIERRELEKQRAIAPSLQVQSITNSIEKPQNLVWAAFNGEGDSLLQTLDYFTYHTFNQNRKKELSENGIAVQGESLPDPTPTFRNSEAVDEFNTRLSLATEEISAIKTFTKFEHHSEKVFPNAKRTSQSYPEILFGPEDPNEPYPPIPEDLLPLLAIKLYESKHTNKDENVKVKKLSSNLIKNLEEKLTEGNGTNHDTVNPTKSRGIEKLEKELEKKDKKFKKMDRLLQKLNYEFAQYQTVSNLKSYAENSALTFNNIQGKYNLTVCDGHGSASSDFFSSKQLSDATNNFGISQITTEEMAQILNNELPDNLEKVVLTSCESANAFRIKNFQPDTINKSFRPTRTTEQIPTAERLLLDLRKAGKFSNVEVVGQSGASITTPYSYLHNPTVYGMQAIAINSTTLDLSQAVVPANQVEHTFGDEDIRYLLTIWEAKKMLGMPLLTKSNWFIESEIAS